MKNENKDKDDKISSVIYVLQKYHIELVGEISVPLYKYFIQYVVSVYTTNTNCTVQTNSLHICKISRTYQQSMIHIAYDMQFIYATLFPCNR